MRTEAIEKVFAPMKWTHRWLPEKRLSVDFYLFFLWTMEMMKDQAEKQTNGNINPDCDHQSFIGFHLCFAFLEHRDLIRIDDT